MATTDKPSDMNLQKQTSEAGNDAAVAHRQDTFNSSFGFEFMGQYPVACVPLRGTIYIMVSA